MGTSTASARFEKPLGMDDFRYAIVRGSACFEDSRLRLTGIPNLCGLCDLCVNKTPLFKIPVLENSRKTSQNAESPHGSHRKS